MTINFLGLDVETYYCSKTYSLAKKDTTTQQYIEDPRFETIGWGLGGVTKNKPIWIPNRADKTLNKIDWDSTIVIAQNAQFDGGVLDYHYGIRPKQLFCTMAMAKCLGIGKLTGSVSLANLAKFFGLRDKGGEVTNANGMRLRVFTPQQLAAYGEYCKNDVWLTNEIFKIMRPFVDVQELMWHSKVNKAFTEPQCRLNLKVLTEELQRVQDRNAEVQQNTASMLGCGVDELSVKLRSGAKFAALLEEHGVKVPMKVSPTTGKDTYAFSKTDTGFIALLESDNEVVQALASARLGAKSTTEESRLVRMIALANLP